MAHVRSEAQNLKNSAEYFKTNSAKKDGGCKWLEAMAVNKATRVAKKKTISKNYISAKYKARYECSSDSDFTAHLLSLEYRR